MPFRTGHSTKRPAGGLRQAGGEGVCRERTRAGGGGRQGGQWHTCPQSAAASPPARVGRGRKEAAHTADSPAAWRPSCARQSCLRVSGNLAWAMPSASHTHTAPALCHKTGFIKAVGLTCPPNSSVGSAAKQDGTPKIETHVLHFYILFTSAPMPSLSVSFQTCAQEHTKNLISLITLFLLYPSDSRI